MCPTGRASFLLVALCLHGSLSTVHTKQEKLIRITKDAVEKPEGSCVTINCTYIFKNETQLLWFKDAVYNHSLEKFDGTIIYSNTEKRPQAPEYSKRVQFFNTLDKDSEMASCTVRINDLQVNDRGNYSFRFINKDKYMSEAMVLTVNENKCKVYIKPLELNKTFKEGDTVIFHCSTSTNCSFDPEWYDPGSGRSSKLTSKIISDNERGEKSSVLTWNVTWKDDGRTLACHADESEDQCLVKTVTLSVEYAPKEVKVKKLTYEVKEDKHLMINCSSKAHPNATFQWFKHNKDDYIRSGNALSWEKLKPENSGVYYCQASNHHGKNNSDNITINVIYPPRRVKVNAKSTSIKKGDRLELTCLVEDSNPAVPDDSYRWYKDRENITDEITNTLIISTITRNDNGSYRCQAENAAGMTDSVPIEVSVKFVPENTYIQGLHEIMLDFTLSLSCLTEANPNSTSYSWYFKPNHAQQYVKVLQAGQVYEIDKVTAFDAGVYMCSPRNNIGTGANSSEFRVVVLYRPNITITYNISSLTHWYEDIPVYLSCSVDCEPPATYYAWYRLEDNTTILSTDQNYTVQPQNPGTYYCYARNDVGISKSDPVKLYANRLFSWWLIPVLTSVVVICFLIAIVCLLYRKIHRNWRGRESFFLSIMPTPSSTGSVSTLLASCNNMRENTVMEGTTELSNFNHPAPIAHPSATDIHAGSPWQVSTLYDVIKQKEQSKEDLYKTPKNYVNLKSTDKDDTTKSASSMADSHSVYAVISKKKQKGHDEDYENISGVCPSKPPPPNMDWDSESSEEEEGVNYSQVSVIVTSQHKPRKQKCSSDEEDGTEYSQVKV